MILDFVTRAVDGMLKIGEWENSADMRLPVRVPLFGIAMALSGIFLIVVAFISGVFSLTLFALAAFASTAYTLLAYKFRRIRVISDEEFRYTDLFGGIRAYKFRNIHAIKQTFGAHTLALTGKRIRIPSTAIISRRLRLLLNEEILRIRREAEATREAREREAAHAKKANDNHREEK